jgi:CRP/FNR family transcriptional regulator, cyclic AMP receptor protein
MNVFKRWFRASRRQVPENGDENTPFLRQHPLFGDLTEDAFQFLLNHFIERRYNRHEVIFKQGNPGVCLFVVRKGAVQVYAKLEGSDESASLHTELGEGGVFGEMSVISTSARTMSAKASEHGTVLLALATFDIEALNDLFPRDGLLVLRGITDTVCQHLAATTRRLEAAWHELETLREKLDIHERR